MPQRRVPAAECHAAAHGLQPPDANCTFQQAQRGWLNQGGSLAARAAADGPAVPVIDGRAAHLYHIIYHWALELALWQRDQNDSFSTGLVGGAKRSFGNSCGGGKDSEKEHEVWAPLQGRAAWNNHAAMASAVGVCGNAG